MALVGEATSPLTGGPVVALKIMLRAAPEHTRRFRQEIAALRQLPPEAATGEAALITRLAESPRAAQVWADLAQGLSQRARRGKAVNLDPAALLMDMVLKLEETAAALVHR